MPVNVPCNVAVLCSLRSALELEQLADANIADMTNDKNEIRKIEYSLSYESMNW
jgi:hypothetical protein